MQQTPLTNALEGAPMTEEDIAMRLDQITKTLRQAGLVYADTPSSLRDQRESGPALFNPLDGLAPMVPSVPQPDR